MEDNRKLDGLAPAAGGEDRREIDLADLRERFIQANCPDCKNFNSGNYICSFGLSEPINAALQGKKVDMRCPYRVK